MLKNNLPLIGVVFLALVLRFYQLGQNPPSLDWDETAHGYNAYSILKTGRDEYGYKFPLSFRSFDDYKPPVYTYLVVPSIAIFGLNDFAVRFPSAFLGVLAVLFTYLMVKELFPRPPSQLVNSLEIRNLKLDIPTLAALMLAISPWHLQFSRVAFETNSAIFWSVFGTFAFLKGINAKQIKIIFWITLASIAFGINLFMYHNARVFIPIYALMLLYLFRKVLWENRVYLILPSVIAIIFSVILIPIVFSISGQLRFKGTTIFADVSPQYKASQLIAQDEQSGQLSIGRIFHNRRFVYIPILVENYLSHFRPDFLFLNADMDRHHAPQIGLLYLWDLPFLLLGLVLLLKTWKQTRSKFLLGWFLIAPIPSSLALGAPASLRLILWMPLLQIIVAMGTLRFWAWSPSQRFCRLFQRIVVIFFFLNFIYVIHQLFVHTPVHSAEIWNYSQKIAVQKLRSIEDRYDRIIFTRRYKQPYIYYLFYNQIDPTWYQANWKPGEIFRGVRVFDKFEFRNIRWEEDKLLKNTLLIGSLKDFPEDVSPIYDIHSLDDIVTLRFVEVNINTSDVSLRE